MATLTVRNIKKKLSIGENKNAAEIKGSGTFTCNGVTPVVVSNTNISANSNIIVTLKTVGGTVGAVPAVKTITASTGFTIAGTASDTSIYNYIIIE